MTRSAIYVGRVHHVRSAPKRHAFSYPMSMLYLDLDELEALPHTTWFGVEAPRPLSFRRRDYLGDPRQPLKAAVLDRAQRELGIRPQGPVRLLTQVRAFGYVFNPVSFYYCFAADGETLQAVVAEITNTPWGERHSYVVAADAEGARQSFDKAFHVSPFFPMTQRYDWRFSVPVDRIHVTMHNLEAGRRAFGAELSLERRPFRAGELARAAVRVLPMSWGVHAAIYFQALRLWLRGIPFFAHPALAAAEKEKCP
jgi:DUF1365 family protein